MHRGLTAEIDIGAAMHNLAEVKKAVNRLPVIAVVKADAYGHGAVELSRAFEAAGANALAVAFVSEAVELRRAGIKSPVLVLFDDTDVSGCLDLDLTPVVHNLAAAKAFSSEAEKRGVTVDVHLKVDTGMGRLGLTSLNEIVSVMELPNVRVSGLMSHFSEADLSGRDFIELQLKRFGAIRNAFREKGFYPPMCHMANSAAVFSFGDSHLDAVRPGLALYGYLPFPPKSGVAVALRPVMKVKAKVLAVRKIGRGQPVSYARTFITGRDTVAAVIASGYADGYPRALSNNSHVIINGRRAPVMGRVCMDLMVVDATDSGEVREQDDAILLGEGIRAWELAEAASTIPYEVLTSFGSRANRVYTGPSA